MQAECTGCCGKDRAYVSGRSKKHKHSDAEREGFMPITDPIAQLHTMQATITGVLDACLPVSDAAGEAGEGRTPPALTASEAFPILQNGADYRQTLSSARVVRLSAGSPMMLPFTLEFNLFIRVPLELFCDKGGSCRARAGATDTDRRAHRSAPRAPGGYLPRHRKRAAAWQVPEHFAPSHQRACAQVSRQ